MGDHDIFWFGLQVFWWKRVANAIITAMGLGMLLNLLSEATKRRWHSVWKRMRDRTAHLKVPPIVRLRTILKWVALVVLTIAASAAFLLEGHYKSGEAVPFMTKWIMFSSLLGIFSLPVFPIVFYISLVYTSFRAVQKFVPKILEWFFHYETFTRNTTWFMAIFFLAASILQLYLT